MTMPMTVRGAFPKSNSRMMMAKAYESVRSDTFPELAYSGGM